MAVSNWLRFCRVVSVVSTRTLAIDFGRAVERHLWRTRRRWNPTAWWSPWVVTAALRWPFERAARGDVTQTHRVWQKSRDTGWLGTGVVVDGKAYVCNSGGVLSCIDVPTGDELWKARTEGGGTWSSVTQTGDGRMFLLTKTGTTTVFQPNADEFQPVAENELNETTNASVVVAGNDIFIRTDESLWCLGQPNGSESSESP